MANIINDDIKLSTVNTNSFIKKVAPVKDVSVTQDRPSNGNNFPGLTATSGTNQEPQKIIGTKELEEAVRNLNEHVKTIQRELHFSIDKDSGYTVIKVVDSETDEVIRQIPNEEAVKVAQKLVENTDFSLLNEYS